MTQSSGVSDSTSSEYAFPLTVSEIIKPSLFLHGPGTNQLPAFTHKGLTLRIAASLHTRALVSGGFLMWFLVRQLHTRPTRNAFHLQHWPRHNPPPYGVLTA